MHSLKEKYVGEEAEEYESRRVKTEKWKKEQEIIEKLVRHIHNNEQIEDVLDVPVGTGRFFTLYKELGLNVLGWDVSSDMLSIAKGKLKQCDTISVEKKNILKDLEHDVSSNLIVCTRFANWLTQRQVRLLVKNFAKVQAEHVIMDVRVYKQHNFKNYFKRKFYKKASNLKSSNIKEFIRSIMSTMYKVLGSQTQTKIHSENFILRTFYNNGYDLKATKRVEMRKDGTVKKVYHLLNNKCDT
ncbi:hypothetical protein SRM_00707 [Salinibacter ruber M8]|jgi:hypothetical protein|uniref:Methyltransferase domain-containing protein n=1 Tax=Salinibacter ruber (strain M8) TaxID=761659 RepID=D5H6H3_SALRM|nr:class I SAM-dependent methyltransferase [Salinibacter ruber]CBH23628.1 hypothetical protein SRM_00707 [Salinibacter ruber M8]